MITMENKRLSLGLDISTQSISAVLLDIDARNIVYEHSLDYCKDPRLNIYGIRPEDYILPPEDDGEASQPALMFFAALDAMFSDLQKAVDMASIVAVNSSGQQHGHVYLNTNAKVLFFSLMKGVTIDSNLPVLLKDALAYDRAPIWMTADTAKQADFIRKAVGGQQSLIKLSGSDAPLRFTGVVMRKIGEVYPEIYQRTENIQLISSLTAAVMTGNSRTPLDYGNACGMSLMDYRQRKWSDALVKAVSDGLPGGEAALKNKLPRLVVPYMTAGLPATYFVNKYGFSRDCRIVAGSGDNPQAKVCVSGDLLSLGSSIVNMVSTNGDAVDLEGNANAMYDGLGRPFMFGCRTNGALVWDRVRANHGLHKDDYAPAEKALQETPLGENLVFWQPRNESFPASPSLELTRITGEPTFAADYSGIIESTLVAVYYHSRGFTGGTSEPLYVTGGAQNSAEILRRVSAIWRRPVIGIEEGGAALGAAAAGAAAYLKVCDECLTAGRSKYINTEEQMEMNQYPDGLLKSKKAVEPKAEDIQAFHGAGGYLEKFAQAEAKLLFKK
jgi:xylulokinase